MNVDEVFEAWAEATRNGRPVEARMTSKTHDKLAVMAGRSSLPWVLAVPVLIDPNVPDDQVVFIAEELDEVAKT